MRRKVADEVFGLAPAARKTVIDDVREQVDFRVQNAVSQTISLEETALRAAAVEVGRSIASLTVTRF